MSRYARKADEAYDSIDWPTAAIVRTLGVDQVGLAWDCCDRGNGQLVATLHALGVEAIGTPDDFLTRTTAPPGVITLLTNPPYGPKRKGELACAFIAHALELGIPRIAMLLRADFDSGSTRQDLFRLCPTFSFKLTLLNRIKWFQGPTEPSDNHCWYCWDREHKGPPTVRYITRAEAEHV